jgi:sugar O-acyltransferase (sialic acid O-acetyltransferase NeuD family)
MTRPLIVLGTGGNAYDVLDIVEAINAVDPTWEMSGFLDDSRPSGSDYLGFEVLGLLRDAQRFSGSSFISSIRNEGSFKRMPEILEVAGMGLDRYATLVHPSALISSRVRIGRGVYVSQGVSIAGGVSVGNHVSFGAGCIIGHDTAIGDYTILAPGAIVSGSVTIASSCFIGAGAMIRQFVNIGAQSLIGIGAVVVREVAAGDIVVGNPARPLALDNRSVDNRSVTSEKRLGPPKLREQR